MFSIYDRMKDIQELNDCDAFSIGEIIEEILKPERNLEIYSCCLRTVSNRCQSEEGFKQDIADFGCLEVLAKFCIHEGRLDLKAFKEFSGNCKALLSKAGKDVIRDCGLTEAVIQEFIKEKNSSCCLAEEVLMAIFFSQICTGSDRNRQLVVREEVLTRLLVDSEASGDVVEEADTSDQAERRKTETVSASLSDTNGLSNRLVAFASVLAVLCTQDDKEMKAPVSVFCRDKLL